MSELTARRLIRAGLVCEAVTIVARGGDWATVGAFLRPKMPAGMTVEQLRAEALAHLERERPA